MVYAYVLRYIIKNTARNWQRRNRYDQPAWEARCSQRLCWHWYDRARGQVSGQREIVATLPSVLAPTSESTLAVDFSTGNIQTIALTNAQNSSGATGGNGGSGVVIIEEL